MIGTYHNCHSMLADILMGLNDYSTARLQGTSTSGPFNNDWITSKINAAQTYLYTQLKAANPDLFLSNSTLTITSSVGTLPWDYGTLVQLKDDKGYPVYKSSIKNLPVTGQTSNDNLYYRNGNTIVLHKSGVSASYDLWYLTKPRDLHQGAASGANTLATTGGKKIADYYNGMIIEDVTGDWVDTVSDYTAARVVTMASETLTSGHFYGIVSELPEPFHYLIPIYALILCKMEHPKVQKYDSTSELASWINLFRETLIAYGYDDKESIEETFTDYDEGSDFFNDYSLFPGT